MALLTRAYLKEHTPQGIAVGSLEQYPEKVLQIGEGNFMRGFVDWMIDGLNRQGLFNGSILVVHPTPRGHAAQLDAQDGLYSLILRSRIDGQVRDDRQIVTAIDRALDPYQQYEAFLASARQEEMRFIFSNTTEAGIAYVAQARPDACPESFPAKLAIWLYERYQAFDGAQDKGMVVIPCELIEQNGQKLREIVLRHAKDWGLEAGFESWIMSACTFLDTLVDRIVTGYPAAEAESLQAAWGYEDHMIDTGEIFHFFAIQGDASWDEELPLVKGGYNVVWTKDVAPYRDRKVRLLNGAHTMSVLAAYLGGLDIVGEMVADQDFGAFLRSGLYQEIIPGVALPLEEKQSFADAVLERFSNPFMKHKLLDISLNSVSKFKVRNLPSIKAALERGEMPRRLLLALAALFAFYRPARQENGAFFGRRIGGDEYPIRDDQEILQAFAKAWAAYDAKADTGELVRTLCARVDFWGEDLTQLPGVTAGVTEQLQTILDKGTRAACAALK